MANAETEGKNWTRDEFGLGTEPLSVDVYTSEEQYEKEIDSIFRHCWLNVGRVDDLPNKGDYVVHNLPELNTSVLLTRDQDGEINAFHNMGSHRGNKVCQESTGNAKFILCEFHGWAFDGKGMLRDIADEPNFFDLDKSKLNLKTISVDSWEGFIFY